MVYFKQLHIVEIVHFMLNDYWAYLCYITYNMNWKKINIIFDN